MVPDAERVLVGFLLAQPELEPALGGRIYTALPADVTWPAVRVVRWGGWAAISRPLWLDEAWCQVDTWADRKAEASELARLMRAIISARALRQLAGVATAVRFGLLIDNPDTTYTPAKPHYRFDLSLMLHPPAAAPPGADRELAAPAARR